MPSRHFYLDSFLLGLGAAAYKISTHHIFLLLASTAVQAWQGNNAAQHWAPCRVHKQLSALLHDYYARVHLTFGPLHNYLTQRTALLLTSIQAVDTRSVYTTLHLIFASHHCCTQTGVLSMDVVPFRKFVRSNVCASKEELFDAVGRDEGA